MEYLGFVSGQQVIVGPANTFVVKSDVYGTIVDKIRSSDVYYNVQNLQTFPNVQKALEWQGECQKNLSPPPRPSLGGWC